VALAAGPTGAEVVGLDFSSDQLEKARRAAADAGLQIRFDEGDCQQMPYDDGSFDVAASVFGLVFAPSQEQAAAELARVTRPGGRVALTAWPDDEWAALGNRLGRPGPKADDARDWSSPEHVLDLLGKSFELSFEKGEWSVSAESPEAVWELVSTSAPPLKTWLQTLDSERHAEVERAYVEFFGAGEIRRDFILVLGSRR
jgi:ubiquinone/menaquinone biosynthesis C-methylase UbiE